MPSLQAAADASLQHMPALRAQDGPSLCLGRELRRREKLQILHPLPLLHARVLYAGHRDYVPGLHLLLQKRQQRIAIVETIRRSVSEFILIARLAADAVRTHAAPRRF